eukprot:4659276-Prymnesium_polylepis.1
MQDSGDIRNSEQIRFSLLDVCAAGLPMPNHWLRCQAPSLTTPPPSRRGGVASTASSRSRP